MSGSVVPAACDSAAAQPPVRFAARPDPLYHGVLLVISCSILALAAVLSVRDRTQVVLPGLNIPLPELCLMRRVTGWGCPGCGMTRCFISLVHGDWAAAWSYNPAGPFLFLVIALQIPFRSWQLWCIKQGRPELQTGIAGALVLGIFASALIGQWVLRLAGVPL